LIPQIFEKIFSPLGLFSISDRIAKLLSTWVLFWRKLHFHRPEFHRLDGKVFLNPGVDASGKGTNIRDPFLFEQQRRTGA